MGNSTIPPHAGEVIAGQAWHLGEVALRTAIVRVFMRLCDYTIEFRR